MAEFLQIVGAMFVALILVLIAILLFLRWKIRSWTKQVTEQVQGMGGLLEKLSAGSGPMAAAMGGMMEPLTLTLERTEDEPDDDFALQIKAWTKGLIGAGFEQLGDFEADPTMLWLRAFTHPQSGAAAVLYIMPMAGAWYDVTARLADDSSITMTDAQREMLDSPPWLRLVRVDAGTPPAKAYEKLLRRIGEDAVTAYTPENFCQSFEAEYRRGAVWRAKRGDMEAEVKRISAADDGVEPSSELVQQLLNSRDHLRANQIDEMLKEQWLKTSAISAYEYEQIEDRIVVVHDLTPADVLIDIWAESYGDDDDNEPDDLPEIAELITNQNPCEAFRLLQQKLPVSGRFEHYGTVEGDIAGDLWLRPDFD